MQTTISRGSRAWAAMRSPCAPCRVSGLASRVRSGGDVDGLLARDRKEVKLVEDAFLDATASPAPTQPAASSAAEEAGSAAATAAASRRPSPQSRALKSRRQRRQDMAAAADGADEPAASSGSDADGPRRCKEAVDAGLALFQQQQYAEAIAVFELALELPGNGAYRLPGSPREYSCPSDAEEQACLYNMACCYAQMGRAEAALACVDGALESGFSDVATLRSDPDLAPLRGQQLEQVIGKYTGVGGALRAVQGLLQKKPKELVSDDGKNMPLLW